MVGDDRLASQLPLFELESWPGIVRLAGWGGPPDRITHVNVGFCEAADLTPVVSVTTVADEAGHEGRIRERLLNELSGRDHDGAAFRGPQGSAAYCAVGDLWVTIEGSSDVDYRLRTIADRAGLIAAA